MISLAQKKLSITKFEEVDKIDRDQCEKGL